MMCIKHIQALSTKHVNYILAELLLIKTGDCECFPQVNKVCQSTSRLPVRIYLSLLY